MSGGWKIDKSSIFQSGVGLQRLDEPTFKINKVFLEMIYLLNLEQQVTFT